jgi:pyruvate kinase
LFKKAALNSNELFIDTFKEGINLVGKELSHAKLKENTERLKQVKKVIKDLKIPESYPNK